MLDQGPHNAISPEEEVAQIQDQGPIGKINPNAVLPGVGEQLIVSDNVDYMKTQPIEKGTEP